MNNQTNTDNRNDAPNVGVQEFTNSDNSVTYVYDLHAIDMEQALNATAVLDFHIEQQEINFESFDKLKETGGTMWIAKCVSALLRKKNPDGSLVAFTPHGWYECEIFVRSLHFTQAKRLRGVLEDFFTNSGGGQRLSDALLSRSNKKRNAMLLQLITQSTSRASSPVQSSKSNNE